jgi:hypothetical protein
MPAWSGLAMDGGAGLFRKLDADRRERASTPACGHVEAAGGEVDDRLHLFAVKPVEPLDNVVNVGPRL